MKCALIGPVHPYRGGIAHYTTLLSQALEHHQHDLLLVSFQRQYPQWLFPGRTDRDPSAKPFATTNAHYWLDSLNPLTWFRTFLRIQRYQPDLLILQWWTLFWFPIWLILLLLNRCLLGVPVLWICHNVLPHEPSRLDRIAAWLLLRWGDRIIVHSAAEAETLRAFLPTVQCSVVDMPAFPIFESKLDRAVARSRLNLPVERKVLLFFGIVRAYKGVSDLVQALPLIYRQWETVTLLIAGEFWKEQKRELVSLIASLDLPAETIVIDDRYIPDEEVSLYFSVADLLVAPYRQVTGSAVIQSALQWGLPIVTTTVVRATLPANQADAIVGWADPGDIAGLANVITNYLDYSMPPIDRPSG